MPTIELNIDGLSYSVDWSRPQPPTDSDVLGVANSIRGTKEHRETALVKNRPAVPSGLSPDLVSSYRKQWFDDPNQTGSAPVALLETLSGLPREAREANIPKEWSPVGRVALLQAAYDKNPGLPLTSERLLGQSLAGLGIDEGSARSLGVPGAVKQVEARRAEDERRRRELLAGPVSFADAGGGGIPYVSPESIFSSDPMKRSRNLAELDALEARSGKASRAPAPESGLSQLVSSWIQGVPVREANPSATGALLDRGYGAGTNAALEGMPGFLPGLTRGLKGFVEPDNLPLLAGSLPFAELFGAKAVAGAFGASALPGAYERARSGDVGGALGELAAFGLPMLGHGLPERVGGLVPERLNPRLGEFGNSVFSALMPETSNALASRRGEGQGFLPSYREYLPAEPARAMPNVTLNPESPLGANVEAGNARFVGTKAGRRAARRAEVVSGGVPTEVSGGGVAPAVGGELLGNTPAGTGVLDPVLAGTVDAGRGAGSSVGGDAGASASPDSRVGVMNPAEIAVDPERFQYKRSTNAVGVTNKLSDVENFNPDLAGVISVWRDPADGRTYVVNGHHRLDLARRAGAPEVSVRYLEAPDAETARFKGAMINIAEGQGTPIDAATVLRSGSEARRQLGEMGVSPRGRVAQEGLALANLNDHLWRAVESGKVSVERGVAIGRAEPDATNQTALYQMIQRAEKGGRAFPDSRIADLAVEVRRAPRVVENAENLFGEEGQVEHNLAIEKAQLAGDIREDLAKDRSTFGRLANEQRAEELKRGNNSIDVAENARIAQEASAFARAFERERKLGNPEIDRLLNEAVVEMQKGGAKTHARVRRELRAKIREELSRVDFGGLGEGVEGGGRTGGGAEGEGHGSVPEDGATPGADGKSGGIKPSRGNSGFADYGDSHGSLPPPTNRSSVPNPRAGVRAPAGRLRSMPAPELIALARALMNGEVPIIKKLRKARGMFKTRGAGEIVIDPKTWERPEEGAQTLAHEIGHLVDFVGDGTAGRSMNAGNVLGRLVGSVRQYLQHTIDRLPTDPSRALSQQDRARLNREAEKAAGKRPDEQTDPVGHGRWITEREQHYTRLVANEVNARDLVTHAEIMRELEELSAWWRPWQRGDNPKYDAYRKSAVELYADAVSVLLNAPKEFQDRAPKAWDLFFNYLDSKPEVRDAYGELQRRLSGTAQEIGAARSGDIRAGFEAGEEKMWEDADERSRRSRRSVWDLAHEAFADTNHEIYRREAHVLHLPEGQRTAYETVENMRYRERVNFEMLGDMEEQVRKPLEAAGISMEDAGEYLFARRIAEGGRSFSSGDADLDALIGKPEFANPLGHTRETAIQQLHYLRETLGAEKYRTLERLMDRWDNIHFRAIENAHDAGFLSDKTFQALSENFGNYATFAVVDYIRDRVPAGIKHQAGTFKEIGNPFATTIMKAVSLNRMAEINRGKRAVVEMMQQHFPAEIGDLVSVKGAEPRNVGHDRAALSYYDKGVLRWVEMDPYVARVFDRLDTGAMGQIAQVLGRGVYGIFHPLYTTLRPAFTMLNAVRDLSRSFRNLGGKGLGRGYLEAVRPAFRAAFGESVPEVEQLKREGILGVRFARLGEEFAPNAYERLLTRYGLLEKSGKPSPKLIEGLKMVFDVIPKIAEGVEIAGKLGVDKALRSRKLPDSERVLLAREYGGTPNTMRRGSATGVTNPLFMYSNIAIQGWIADMSLGLKPKTAGGWWVRTLVTTVLPKLVMAGAAYGYFGKQAKEEMDAVSDDQKARYFVIPLGSTEGKGQSKTVAIRLPMDDTSRVLGSVVWNFLTGQPQKGVAAFDSDLPLRLNPLLDGLFKWKEFGEGKNPEDSFRNKPIIPEKAFAAGHPYSTEAMVKWQSGQLGILSDALDLVFPKRKVEPINGLDSAVARSRGLNPFLIVSDMGAKEKEQAAIQGQKGQVAERYLSLGEETRSLVAEHGRLQALKTAGGLTSLAQRQRFARLQAWYSGVYVRTMKGYKVASPEVKAGIRDRVEESAKGLGQ